MRIRNAAPAALLLMLPSCGALQRLSEVGRPPAMTPTANPTTDPGWRPVTMPMPKPQTQPPEANSLWRTGSRAFFKDQRASQVGDIVTILVNMNDTAALQDDTQTSTANTENMGMPNMFNLESALPKILGKAVNAASLVDTNSSSGINSKGQIARDEQVTLRLAGIITQVLPNGNMVVVARQQVRINDELRVLQVSGVLRPQDIASDNTIQHDRLAEARISYGGRGTLSNIQQPRYGQQLLDIMLPF